MGLLKPMLVLNHVTDITPNLLSSLGLKGLLLDLDNTVVEYGSYQAAREVHDWTEALLASGVQLYFLSNAMPERVRFWTRQLGFTGVGLASKPVPRAFRKALQDMQLEANEVAMVGDQLFTDVLGGNLVGMYTIMVRPLAQNALPHTKIARRMERLVLRRYGLHGWTKGAEIPPHYRLERDR